MNVLLVALGGAIGSVGRYLMGAWFQALVGKPGFPWGTFLVNVMGAFLIGVAFGLSKDGPLSSQAWTLVVIGALGGYTTYSTYALETLEQFADGRTGGGLLNAFGQLAVSLITAYLGVLLVRGFQGMGGSIYELLFRSQDTLSRTLASIHRDAERDCLEKRAEAHR